MPAPPKKSSGIAALVFGVIAIVSGVGYGAFLVGYAATQREGTFYDTVTSTWLVNLVNLLFVLPWVILLVAVIAVVLGAVAMKKPGNRAAGQTAVVLGILAPWLPFVGAVQTLLMSFAWM